MEEFENSGQRFQADRDALYGGDDADDADNDKTDDADDDKTDDGD